MPAPPGTNIGRSNQPTNQPWVEIIEQPSSKSTRFRYESENQQGGVLSGANSTKEKQTHPTIKVHNHNGACVVVVSLVTHDDGEKPKPHPHTLVGPECRQGVCTKKVKQNLDCIQFPNLGIQCKKKAELKEALTLRQQIRVDPFRTGFEHMEKPQLNNINLMVVKLCFQVFLPDESGKYQRPVPAVCSEPIQDKKSAGELSIHSYLPESCPVAGREEMILLTGKLPKADELEVRFYEGRHDKPDWEGFGTFTQKDIHQSVALTIKVPEYTKSLTNNTKHKLQVFMELRKKSNPEDKSQQRRFFYLIGDSKNRYRPGKRESEAATSSPYNKKIKHDPSYSASDVHQPPTVLDAISMETNSSGGSAFNSGTNGYPSMYNQQVPPGPPQAHPPPAFQSYNRLQPHQPPHHQQQPPQHQPLQQQPQQQYAPIPSAPGPTYYTQNPQMAANGQDYIRVRLSDVNIYRNDDSGKVFMAPGPTAPNQLAKEVELNDEYIFGNDMSIEDILRLARDDPESEIHIPSNFSEHFRDLLNPTLSMLEGEVIQSGETAEEQLHTSSLTRELKDLPQSAA